MSDYYNPYKTYGLYIPGSPTPFKVSRTKINFFFKCPKCFYLDRILRYRAAARKAVCAQYCCRLASQEVESVYQAREESEDRK